MRRRRRPAGGSVLRRGSVVCGRAGVEQRLVVVERLVDLAVWKLLLGDVDRLALLTRLDGVDAANAVAAHDVAVRCVKPPLSRQLLVLALSLLSALEVLQLLSLCSVLVREHALELAERMVSDSPQHFLLLFWAT